MARNNYRTRRHPIPRRHFLPRHRVPHRLPFQASARQIHHADFAPKYQLIRWHLYRHSQRQMEPRAYCIQTASQSFFAYARTQPRRPACSRPRKSLQNKSPRISGKSIRTYNQTRQLMRYRIRYRILGIISSFIMYSPMFLFVPRSTSPDTRPEKLRSNFRTRCRDVNPDAVSFLLTHPLLYSPMNY